jgi:hypothetical protein
LILATCLGLIRWRATRAWDEEPGDTPTDREREQ